MPDSRIALVTAAAARNLDEDLPALAAALTHTDVAFDIVDWDDAQVDWSAYDIAVLRSTWDYTTRLAEFLDWAARISQVTRLLNPLDVIRWNTDKHYLGDLARAGVAAVASHFIEPGEDAATLLERFLHKHETSEFVVKPSVGAGSRDAQRYGHEERAIALAHAQRLLDAGRSVLLQPYLDRVDAYGETALIYFDGKFSHAIRKGPLLKRGAESARGLFAVEQITAREPSSAEREIAQRALDAIPFARPLLYARADLIHDESGAPRLLELELTEPSVFLDHAAGAAERFARAILGRLR